MAVGDKGLERLTLQTMLNRFAELAANEVILGNYKFDGLVQIKERAASGTFTAAYGQIFVKTASPAELWFADDAGLESQVMIGAAGPVAEVNDLTSVVTWANIPDANVPESAVTQHRAALLTSIAAGSAGSPSLAWGDGDTGFYELSDGIVNFTSQGVGVWSFRTGAILPFNAAGPAMLNEAATATNPTFTPNTADQNSGLGWESEDVLALISGGVSGLQLKELNSGVVQIPSATVGITAFATGGQGSAVALINSYNVIGTCASAGDSVKLPAVYSVNSIVYVKNDGAESCDVFPASGDDLGEGNNTALAVASGESATFIATTANAVWTQLIKPPGGAGADPLLLGAGSVGAPPYSFAGDPDTGVYNVSADILGLAAGGVQVAQAKEASGANQFIIAPGVFQNNAAKPSLAFGSANTGFYESADNIIAVSIAGTAKCQFSTTFGGIFQGFDLLYTDGSVTVPVYRFAADTNTGLGRDTDILSMIAGGVAGLQIRALNSGVVQIPAADVAITAFATGGQGSAVALKQSYNVISVCASAGDSVKLPALFNVNSIIYIKNDGANSLDVFPASSDDLGAGADTAVAVASGASIQFIATIANATWTQSIVGGGTSDPLLLGDGTEGAPTYSFTDDPNTGFYANADGIIGVTINGDVKYKFGASFSGNFEGFDMLSTDGNITTPVYRFAADLDTGLGRATNILSMIAGGVACLQVRALSGGGIQIPDADIAITAFSGGGQASAVQLNASYSMATTVGLAGDSVKLPPIFIVNSIMHIRNSGANSMDVFPGSGDDLGQGTNTAEALAAGVSITYIATAEDATWAPF